MSKDNQQNIIIEQLAESKDALESIENMVSDIKVPQKMKVELEGVETITIKGDKGDKGDTGPEGKQGKQGEKGTKGDTGSAGKDGKDGKDGKIGKQGLKGDKGDKGKDGKDGIDGTNGEDGSPDTPEDIVYKINSLPENAFSPKIDASHIKGLPTQGGSSYNERRGAMVAGSDTEIQFNDGGKLGANSALTFDKDTETLTITNDKVLTSNQSALVISATAANTDSGAGLIDVRQTNTSSTKALAYLKQASTSGGARNLWLENDGTGDGLFIDQDGNAKAIAIDSEATTNPGVEIDIVDGDAHLRLVGDSGNASPTEGDLWRESDSLRYYDGTDEINLLEPYKNLWIPAGAMTPRVTNGAAGATEEYATNDVMLDYFLFDGTTEEGVQFTIAMPDDWDVGTIKAKFYWDAATGASAGDGVTWGISAQALSNDDAIDTAFAASVDTDDVVIAVGDLHVSPASAAVTVSGTPALGDMCIFEVTRVVGDAQDDMTEDAKLIGVMIQYKRKTATVTAW